MEDDGHVHTVRGKDAFRELPQDPRVGEAVQAVPDREHVEQCAEHGEDHDGEEIIEKIL